MGHPWPLFQFFTMWKVSTESGVGIRTHDLLIVNHSSKSINDNFSNVFYTLDNPQESQVHELLCPAKSHNGISCVNTTIGSPISQLGQLRQSHQMWSWFVTSWYSVSVWPDWAIYLTLGNFLKPLATINLSKSPTFLGNFCMCLKIYYFSSESILGNFYIWQFLSGHTVRCCPRGQILEQCWSVN